MGAVKLMRRVALRLALALPAISLAFSAIASGVRHSGAAPLPLRTHMSLAASEKFGATLTTLTYGTLVFRTKYVFTQDMANLRVEPQNWLYPPDTGGASFAITAMYLEGASFSCLVQVTWSGSGSTTVASQTVARNPSDTILPSQCGLAVFPAGGSIFLRIQITATVGSAFPDSTKNYATSPSPERGWQFNSATTTFNAVNGTGDINVTSGTDYAGMAGSYMPLLVGVRNSASTAPASVVVGDSEIDNDGNATYNLDSYLNRGIRGATWPSTQPAILVISHGGRSQTQLATDTEWQRVFRYVSMLVDEHGTNALTDGPSAPQSQLTYYVAARAAGMQRVFHVGLYPETLSSDGWATLANQTFSTGDTNVTAFNAWIATKVADGTASYIDGQWTPTSASIRDATNSHAWKTTGSAGAYTTDGLHMAPLGAGNPLTACGTEFATWFATQISGLLEPAN